ncbi:hypothetical protein F4778DRAFT_787160 [Xylariomycetidae sp. FL2044]|nr:hypothetical protein F4778DRAFT_787160 [Xylariomycetidae sp. FL2044]
MAKGLFRLPGTRWRLSRWIALIRLSQALGSLVTAVMNGFLLVYIQLNRLGLASSMFALEMMVCVALIYTSFVLLVQHTGSRRDHSSTTMIAFFVAGDAIFNGITLAIITVLARSGVPSDCHGLTRDNVEPGDAPDDPPEGYNTIRFSDGKNGDKGLLDRYCALERGFYFIAIAMVFAYMITVTLGIIRIYERQYTREIQMGRLTNLDDIHRLEDLTSKVDGDVENASEASQGIVEPRSRGVVVSPSPEAVSPAPGDDRRRERSRSPAPPVSPLSPISPGSRTSRHVATDDPFVGHSAAFSLPTGGPRIEDAADPAAEAAITDGYRHQMRLGMAQLPPYSPGPSRERFMGSHAEDDTDGFRFDGRDTTRMQNGKDAGTGLH